VSGLILLLFKNGNTSHQKLIDEQNSNTNHWVNQFNID